MSVDYASKRKQLDHDGFCLLENIIDDQMLAQLQTVTDEMLSRQAADHFEENRSQGSLISVFEHPSLAKLVSYQPMLAALAKLGFDNPKWTSGFVISKPPDSPALFWHQDARFWDDPIIYTPQIIQCFMMIYLVDTTPENGCLRLIPGSHLKRHPLHDALPDAHGDNLGRMDDPQHLAFKRAEGEVDVPVKRVTWSWGARGCYTLRTATARTAVAPISRCGTIRPLMTCRKAFERFWGRKNSRQIGTNKTRT